MADRIASAVFDDEDDFPVPVVDNVFSLSKEEVVNAPHDPFALPANVVKSLNGTNANFKRRVTTELKKYNQSADGSTKSKQLEDDVQIVGYDAFGVMPPPHNLEGLAKVYESMSSPHYAAVNAKVSNIVGLGYRFVETTKTKRSMEKIDGNEKKLKSVRATLDAHRDDLLEELEGFNDEDSFTEILTKVYTDFEVTGNGYIEVGRKRDGSIGYLGHVPSISMRVRRNHDGYVQISANKAQFFANFGDTGRRNPIGDGSPNEIIHIKNHTPTNTYYGVPDIVAAEGAVAANIYVQNFNIEFFENKAVPRHLITLKGANLGQVAQADLLAFFETGLKGQNHRSLFIPLPADTVGNEVEFKIEPIDAKVQESSFTKYWGENRNQILTAHRVPITKVDVASSASLAIARDADKTFKEQVCGPRQNMLEKKLNRIIKTMTDAFELKLNEMTLTDADTQSKIDERMVKSGIWTANEVRVRDGKPAIPGGDERVDLNAKDKIAQQVAEERSVRERDAARSATSPDTSGEARQPKGDGRAQG
jgi:PBSX family phage portal protein